MRLQRVPRKLAFQIFFRFKARYPETAIALLPLFVEYGYWKDLLLLTEVRTVHALIMHKCAR